MIQIDLTLNHLLIIKVNQGKVTCAKKLVRIKTRLKTEIGQSIITKRGGSIGGRRIDYFSPSFFGCFSFRLKTFFDSSDLWTNLPSKKPCSTCFSRCFPTVILCSLSFLGFIRVNLVKKSQNFLFDFSTLI